jgi:hypothetical protein
MRHTSCTCCTTTHQLHTPPNLPAPCPPAAVASVCLNGSAPTLTATGALSCPGGTAPMCPPGYTPVPGVPAQCMWDPPCAPGLNVTVYSGQPYCVQACPWGSPPVLPLPVPVGAAVLFYCAGGSGECLAGALLSAGLTACLLLLCLAVSMQ